ncbi:MAG: GNAT family N-acetyltransferase [Gaiellaceae bacterium]
MVDVSGPRVRLRPLTVDDIEALVAGREADPASFGPRGDEARERLRKQIERNPTLQDGGLLELAVEGEGRLIGDVQARAPKHAFPRGVCEIGISLLPDVRGQGFGREAVALFTEHLFGEGLERVQASTSVDNLAMRRVLELVGYDFEGVLQHFAPTADGGREDYAMYAATRRDWRKR